MGVRREGEELLIKGKEARRGLNEGVEEVKKNMRVEEGEICV